MNWKEKKLGAGLGAMAFGPIGVATGGLRNTGLIKMTQILIKKTCNGDSPFCRFMFQEHWALANVVQKRKKRLRLLADEWLADYGKPVIREWFDKHERAVITIEDCGIFLCHLPSPILNFVILNLLSVLYSDGPIDDNGRRWLLTLIQCSGIKLDLWILPWRFFERGDAQDMHKTDALSILGLSEGCSTNQLKAAYRQACLDYDPNLLGNIAIPIRKLAEEKSKEINLAYEYLQSSKKHSGLFVILANREIKQLESVSEREVVHCLVCDTRNRLPEQRHHRYCRCEMCHALLTFSEQLLNNAQP